MTGSPALAFLEEDSLDPPSHSDGGAANAILSVHELNLEAAAQRLAVKACNKPFAGYGLAAFRGAILATLDCRTRADAMGALSLLEGEDRELRSYMVAALRAFLDVV